MKKGVGMPSRPRGQSNRTIGGEEVGKDMILEGIVCHTSS